MAAPVIIPELQFVDADGHPYAGGSIATYLPGTSTPKPTYVDPDGTALQTNPAILDAAGRCLMWGDGEYRLILRDAAGNLIWDQPATTIVSAAMQPVVSAPTIADAKVLLGVGDVAAEAAARAAADSAEQTARIAADTTLQTNITAETTRATAAETTLQSNIDAINSGTNLSFEAGTSSTSTAGFAHVTFGTPFTSNVRVVATVADAAVGDAVCSVNPTLTGFDCYTGLAGLGGTPTAVNRAFYWIAVGIR